MKNWAGESINRKFSEMCLQVQVYKHAHKEETAIHIQKTAPKAKEVNSSGLKEITGR